MTTKAISTTSSSSSTFSAPMVHIHRKGSDPSTQAKTNTVYASFTSSNQTTLASVTATHSTPLPSLPPRIPASDVVVHTTFSFDMPLDLGLRSESPPLPPPPSSDKHGGRSHRKTSDPSTHSKIHTVFSSSRSSTQTATAPVLAPLEKLARDIHTLSVPVSTRGRSHSASPRSREKEDNPNHLFYTEFAPSSSSSASTLSSDLLKPTRMSRQRSNSLQLPPESGSSTSSKTTPVRTRYSYHRKGGDANWCFVQMRCAEAFVKQSKPAKAIEIYKTVIAEDRKSIVPWAEPYIRVAALQANNPEEARQTLNLVIKGKNFDPWATINALVMDMIVLAPSQEYTEIAEAYESWRKAKELIRAQPDSMTVKAFLGHYGKIAKGIRVRKEAIEGATTTA